MFHTNLHTKQTHIVCSVFFVQNCAIYEIILKKNNLISDRPYDNITRGMRFACCTTNVKDTHSEYIILIAFAMQHWLSEGASILRHMYEVCSNVFGLEL